MRGTFNLGALLVLCMAGLSSAQAQEFVFRDVSADSGLRYAPAAPRYGASAGDYDGDGRLDLCWAGGADPAPRIYRNNSANVQRSHSPGSAPGSGPAGSRPDLRPALFVDVTDQVFPAERMSASHALFADLDNDGDQDLVLARRYGSHQDVGFGYYENVGGLFVPGRVSADLGRHPISLGGMSLGDVDNDGDLDVVIVHNITSVPGPGSLLRNDLPRGFSDATANLAPALLTNLRHWTPVLADFNGNGRCDLHVAIDFEHDLHCRNLPGLGLVDDSLAAGVVGGGSDMGLAVGDPDGDGDLDMVSTNISRLVYYVNDGAGVFQDLAASRGLGNSTYAAVAWGAVFADFDHDQDEDLGFVSSAAGGILSNDSTGVFQGPLPGSGLDLFGSGLLAFDLDNDGDLDLLTTDASRRPALFENISPAAQNGHWLIVETQGAFSNRDGVGAEIRVLAGGSTQRRSILASSSFFSGPPKNAHFGLGTESLARSITIKWPSGIVRRLHHVPADQSIVAYELSADLDLDCDVDVRDLFTLVRHLGQASAEHSQGDIDGDRDVDFFDLLLLLDQFRDRCTNQRGS